MRTRLPHLLIGSCCLMLIGLVWHTPRLANEQQLGYQTYRYSEPIDALSVGIPASVAHQNTKQSHRIDLFVQGFTPTGWTEWEQLELEKEFDPLMTESNLIIFPTPVSSVRIAGGITDYDIHPIVLSDAPASYKVASIGTTERPRILSRTDWKADESLLYRSEVVSSLTQKTVTDDKTSTAIPQRVQDCNQAQVDYPETFKTSHTVTHSADGQRLRWARRYSRTVDFLVVHHTALQVAGDTRSPVERMRAMYKYHTVNRGWGDIGYHYIIDENGQIYEGRSGGDYVIGGHVYCSNVGTIGVALMGNFELEQPSQAQMQGLQWLLRMLGDRYSIDLSQQVRFRGNLIDPIQRHGDRIETSCPGFYVNNTIDQVRHNVQRGHIHKTISFPRKPEHEVHVPKTESSARTLYSVGSLRISGKPRTQLPLQITYKAPASKRRRSRIGSVTRSENRIGLQQEWDGRFIPVRNELLLPRDVRSGERISMRLKVDLPSRAGRYQLHIGNLTYDIFVEGRATTLQTEARQTSNTLRTQPNMSRPVRRVRPELAAENQSSNIPVRIRLTTAEADTLRITGQRLSVGGRHFGSNTLTVIKHEDQCLIQVRGRTLHLGTAQVESADGIIGIESNEKPRRRYRGTIECQIIDGELALINELPIEAYLWGLSEQPDSEPWEKQRAFAIAARTYAAHYTVSPWRKFPGKPYDGNDSPANFQKYTGYDYERRNPEWVRAVKNTSGLVLKKDDNIIRAAYYSSNAGRTKTPDENGWPNFPYKEVYVSTEDPWCIGFSPRGHGVGMSGCGAEAQALEGKKAEEILYYYYTGVDISPLEP